MYLPYWESSAQFESHHKLNTVGIIQEPSSTATWSTFYNVSHQKQYYTACFQKYWLEYMLYHLLTR